MGNDVIDIYGRFRDRGYLGRCNSWGGDRPDREMYHAPTKNYIVPELFIYIRDGERCNRYIWSFQGIGVESGGPVTPLLMFRLQNTDLPVTVRGGNYAKTIRLFKNANRNLAPLIKADPHLARIQGGIPIADEPLYSPSYVGKYLEYLVPYVIDGSEGIALTFADNPLTMVPNNYWRENSKICVFARKDLSFPTLIEITVRGLTPPADVDIYRVGISTWVGFTATTVYMGGQEFTYTAGTPAPGQFTVASQTIEAKGYPGTVIPLNSDMYIIGTQSLASSPAIAAIAVFITNDPEFAYQCEWAGRTYRLAQSITAPRVGEFFWENGYFTLFMPPELLVGISGAEDIPDEYDWATQAIGTLTFDKPVEQ